MHVCASAVVTESTSGVAFPSLHFVAFGRRRKDAAAAAHSALIQSVNSAYRYSLSEAENVYLSI